MVQQLNIAYLACNFFLTMRIRHAHSPPHTEPNLSYCSKPTHLTYSMDCMVDSYPFETMAAMPYWSLTPSGNTTADATCTRLGQIDPAMLPLGHSMSASTYTFDAAHYPNANAPMFQHLGPNIPHMSTPPMDRATFMEQLQGAVLSSPLLQPQLTPPVPIEVFFEKASSWQKRKTLKRREQNKKSQQAYRARKEQHKNSLANSIESTMASLQQLQDDNSRLLQALCDIRTENNDLRRQHTGNDSTDADADMINQSLQSINLANEDSLRVGEQSARPSLSQQAIESLHDPLQAIRNLLSYHLSHGAKRRDFVTVLERLEAFARHEKTVKMKGSGLGGHA